jgi:hypothetical protein
MGMAEKNYAAALFSPDRGRAFLSSGDAGTRFSEEESAFS